MTQKKNDLAIIAESDLSLISDNALNAKQMQVLLQRTPAQFVKERPAKGGGKWNYVTGGYVRKCLNLMFGFKWSFEVVSEQIIHGEAVVKGRLTINAGSTEIVKMQFGNKEIVCRRGTEIPLSIGNDLKAAATDALKKCAAEIGLAADIYNQEDFQEVHVETLTVEDLQQLYNEKKAFLNEEQATAVERIINKKEVHSYKRAFDFLNGVFEEKEGGAK